MTRAVRTQRLLLWGPPGVGKSTLLRTLAKRWNVRAIDTDQHIETTTGRSIPELFATIGEAAFRELERAVVSEAVDNEDVALIAVGGGALVDASLRARARSRVLVVGLTAPIEVLVARLRDASDRPLLAGDREQRLRTLLHTRQRAYADVDLSLDASGNSLDVANELEQQLLQR